MKSILFSIVLGCLYALTSHASDLNSLNAPAGVSLAYDGYETNSWDGTACIINLRITNGYNEGVTISRVSTNMFSLPTLREIMTSNSIAQSEWALDIGRMTLSHPLSYNLVAGSTGSGDKISMSLYLAPNQEELVKIAHYYSERALAYRYGLIARTAKGRKFCLWTEPIGAAELPEGRWEGGWVEGGGVITSRQSTNEIQQSFGTENPRDNGPD